jgi:cephalosporin hydroxylase
MSGSRSFPRTRSVVARRLDPWAVRRTQELIRRGDSSASLGDELDAVGRAWLRTASSNRADEPRVRRAVSSAFARLWQPATEPVDEPAPVVRNTIRDQFHRLYYNVSDKTWKDTWYRGVRTYKCPTDMWVYQELIDNLQPGLVVETGTFRGGSGLFIADRLEILGHGEVVTIDVNDLAGRPEHPRLTYLHGSSIAPEILDEVRRRLPTDGSPVLVILDSDHSEGHVAAELEAYASLVTVGSYLVVEDTNVNGHPASPGWGPGPFEAVQKFLETDPGYIVDRHCERYYLTQNPSGYLRRVR